MPPQVLIGIHFLRDLALVLAMDVAFRLFFLVASFLHRLIPLAARPEELRPYIDLEPIRAIATITEVAVILLAAVLTVLSVIKMVRTSWRAPH